MAVAYSKCWPEIGNVPVRKTIMLREHRTPLDNQCIKTPLKLRRGARLILVVSEGAVRLPENASMAVLARVGLHRDGLE
jgi:hypothetical protein